MEGGGLITSSHHFTCLLFFAPFPCSLCHTPLKANRMSSYFDDYYIQSSPNSQIIHLSLPPHLNDITVIIRAAGAANIPTVDQHCAPVALRPHRGGEGGRRRWTRAGGRGGWILGQEAGSSWTRRGSWTRQPSWEHGPCVEARQRLTVREREAWREHGRHAGAQHEWWQGSRSWTRSLDHWRGGGWWCWGRCSSGRRRGRGCGDCAGSAKAKQVWVHITGVSQLRVGGLEVRRACPHEKRVPQWATQHGWVETQRREAVAPGEGEALWGQRGWGVLACKGLLTGPLLQGRGGGFALGARSQVLGGRGVHVGLDNVIHRGVVVAHVSTAQAAPTVRLQHFGGGQVVRVALRRLLGLICGSRAARVALQLVDDLWAVRGQWAGQGVGGALLPPVGWHTAIRATDGHLLW